MVILDANILIRAVLLKRGIDPEAALAVFAKLSILIGCIDAEIYGPFETAARQRLQKLDEEDWPVLATALALECPIWTEDADFFGSRRRALDHGSR